MPTRASSPTSSAQEPRWLTALLQEVERYQEPQDPAVWIQLMDRREHAMTMFQEFAHYFLAATADVAKPLKTYRPEHVFGIRIRHLQEEIHGWVDLPNIVRPDSVPRLRIEVGNRFVNPSDEITVLWQTTVSDHHTSIDFSPAAAAWTHWLRKQPPPPTLAERRAHYEDIMAIIMLIVFLVFSIIFSAILHIFH